MIKYLLLCLLPLSSLTAGKPSSETTEDPAMEFYPEAAEKAPPACVVESEQAQPVTEVEQAPVCIVEKGGLKAVVLVSNLSEVEKTPDPSRQGVDFYNLDVPGKAGKLEGLLRMYFGMPIDRDLILSLRSEILSYYIANGQPMIVIDIPPQDITEGILQFVINESTIDQIKITGTRYYPLSQICRMIRQQPGEVVKSNVLLRDVDWINRSPFRHADLIMAPGEKENTTNLEVRVTDRFPFRVYAGVDNTGTQATGHNRWFGGFSWANAFNLDHTLSYQGTVSGDFHQFVSHTLNYVAPLSYRHILMFYGGYSKVHPEITDFHTTGESAQVSGRYQIPFGALEYGILQEFVLGADYKNTNNNLTLLAEGEIPIVTSHIEYVQLMAGYSFGKKQGRHTMSLNAQAFGSPGQAFGDSSDAKFNELRLGAKNFYLYGKFMASYTYEANRFGLFFMQRFQLSTTPLLPPEQYGVGGYDTVRGYPEREINADNAFIFNMELRSPKMELFSLLWKNRKKYNDSLMVYGFFDYGYTSEVKAMPGEDVLQQLFSVGPGLKYNLEPFLSLRIDWGIRLRNTQFEDAWGGLVHFGLLAGY